MLGSLRICRQPLNRLKMQSKALITSVIRPDTLYFLKLCNFTLNIFHDFVSRYLNKNGLCKCFLKLFLGITWQHRISAYFLTAEIPPLQCLPDFIK